MAISAMVSVFPTIMSAMAVVPINATVIIVAPEHNDIRGRSNDGTARISPIHITDAAGQAQDANQTYYQNDLLPVAQFPLPSPLYCFH